MSLKRILKEFTEEFYRDMHAYGAKIEDTAEIGDHEIAVVYDRNIGEYQLIFQRKGRNTFNPDEQITKFSPENIQFSDLKLIIHKVKQWVQEYERLLVGSFDPNKTRIYKRIFDRSGIAYQELSFGDLPILVLGTTH